MALSKVSITQSAPKTLLNRAAFTLTPEASLTIPYSTFLEWKADRRSYTGITFVDLINRSIEIDNIDDSVGRIEIFWVVIITW